MIRVYIYFVKIFVTAVAVHSHAPKHPKTTTSMKPKLFNPCVYSFCFYVNFLYTIIVKKPCWALAWRLQDDGENCGLRSAIWFYGCGIHH